MFLQKEKGFSGILRFTEWTQGYQRNRCPQFEQHRKLFAPRPWVWDRPGRVTAGRGGFSPGLPGWSEETLAWYSLGRDVVRILIL